MFHAMPKLTASGLHSGALLGFMNTLRMLLRNDEPDYLVVAFDIGRSFRAEIFADYKGHRPEMPVELREQWPIFPQLVEAFGVIQMGIASIEADDIIGTLAHRYAGPEVEVTIISNDKDFSQLVSPYVKLLELKSKNTRVYSGVDDVTERFGVEPGRVIDVRALSGDASDNIQRVPGIGDKKGAALIQRFGSLDALMERADEVSGKTGEKLRENRDIALLSRELARIRLDVELGFGLEDLAVGEWDRESLRELAMTYQFRTLVKELSEDAPAGEGAVDRSAYRCVNTLDALAGVVEGCRASGRVAVATETTSLEPLAAQMVGISVCWSETDAVYIPFGHTQGDQLDEAVVREVFGPLLADAAVGKWAQNFKYDLHVFENAGWPVNGLVGDTMIADFLLESSRNQHGLDDLALRYLGHQMISYSEAVEGLGDDATFANVSIEKATVYAAEDAHVAWLIHEQMMPKLEEQGLMALYLDVEVPLIPVLVEMERNGMALDVELLVALGAELETRRSALREEIHAHAGHEFNVKSPAQLGTVLFDEIGLEPIRKTKTGRSTDAKTLDALVDRHPIVAAVLEFRKIDKLKNTYVDTLPRTVNAQTGRVHTTLQQTAAATGRLASQGPNLQNIPIRSADGRRIRTAFVARAGCVLLSADYSQVELRVLADYCGEGALVEAFLDEADIHAATASEIFGVMPGLVSAGQRRVAKAINFGLIYGMGAFRLSRDLKIPRREAQSYIDGYFARYPQVRVYMDQAVDAARAAGYAVTKYGRRRMIADLSSRNHGARQASERVALNTPMQGTAADIMKMAMIRVSEALRRDHPNAALLLQVHDELLVEVPEAEVEAVAETLRREMSEAADLVVPLSVGVGYGSNWEAAH